MKSGSRERMVSLRVLFLSSEIAPFAKTGGLADVLAALPKALSERGHDVRLVMPLYASAHRVAQDLRLVLPEVVVHFPGRLILGKIYQSHVPGTAIPIYLISNPAFYDRPELYGESGVDYPDNALRFGFYCMAALWMLKGLGWAPDILHCNDWQTGLVPLFRKTRSFFQNDPFFARSRILYSIHNLGYLGIFPPGILDLLGIPHHFNHPECLEYWGGISLAKAGIYFSDAVGTVSEQYAREILTREYGCGLDGYLQYLNRRPRGILNGVDYVEWDPVHDPLIRKNFSIDDLEGKAECKAALQKTLRWPIQPRTPIIAMINRLDSQKGMDLVLEAFPELFNTGARFVVLGNGNPAYHAPLRKAQKKNPRSFRARIGFDPKLAHVIEAGADALLMPSRYEPCGLNQMYSMRYGTVPIVRFTGGLADTVTPATRETLLDRTATGFVFREYKSEALIESVQEAVFTYHNFPDIWLRLQKNGMRRNYPWSRSAEAYEKLYLEMLEK